jgi:hypothetical protein
MQVRDPRGDSRPGVNTKNPQTGTAQLGGLIDIAGVDLGNGTCALATIEVTRTSTTVGHSATSVQLLAADSTRLAATIVNTDSSKTLYIGLNGAAAVVGTNPVAPNAAYNVDPKYVAGQVNGIWDAGATGGASILATTA